MTVNNEHVFRAHCRKRGQVELRRNDISDHLPASNPIDEIRRRIREWQVEDRTPTMPARIPRSKAAVPLTEPRRRFAFQVI
jgi:hypothetical protein